MQESYSIFECFKWSKDPPETLSIAVVVEVYTNTFSLKVLSSLRLTVISVKSRLMER